MLGIISHARNLGMNSHSFLLSLLIIFSKLYISIRISTLTHINWCIFKINLFWFFFYFEKIFDTERAHFMVMAYLNVDCSIQSQNYINGTPQYAVIAEKSCKSFSILNVQAPDTCCIIRLYQLQSLCPIIYQDTLNLKHYSKCFSYVQIVWYLFCRPFYGQQTFKTQIQTD